MKKLLAATALAVGTLTAGATALATTIDFDTGASGCQSSIVAGGVTFTANDGGGLTRDGFGTTPNSTPGIISCNNNPFATIRAQFGSLVNGAISIDLGDFNADADTLTLTLFDAANAVLATVSQNIPASFIGMVTLTASASGVDHVVFGGVGVSGSSVYADNFTFNAARVPEPATLALLGLGFAAMGLRRRARG